MPKTCSGNSAVEKLDISDGIMEFQRQKILLKTGALQDAIFNSANFSSIATDEKGVIGFSEALKDGLMGPMSDSQQEYIGDIFTSGQHLLSLINDILDLSKVEAGLGLAMVGQLAELHGGTVAVASAEGEGARFAAWLPLRTPAQAAPTLLHSAGAATMAVTESKGRVALMVEDDDRAADLIRLLLEVEGFTVLRAASAEAALLLAPLQTLSLITLDLLLPGIDGWEFLLRIRESGALAQRLRPDLILLDLMMPDVNDFDVVEALQGNAVTARIPILVVTAKQITAQDRAALNNNPDKIIHIIEKSGFNRDRFIAEVKRALLPH